MVKMKCIKKILIILLLLLTFSGCTNKSDECFGKCTVYYNRASYRIWC